MSVTDDGERVYVAGTTAGFYVLDSEAIAHHNDAELAAGTAGCNQRSTIVSVDGVIDASKLAAVANDCLHMVVNNDPGPEGVSRVRRVARRRRRERYLVLMTRSRFDVYPPVNATPTGTHSAVFVPEPARAGERKHEEPAGVRVAHRRERRLPAQLRADAVGRSRRSTPIMIGAFAIPDNQIEECLDQAITEPNGEPRRRVAQQNHNPTVFKNSSSTPGTATACAPSTSPYRRRRVKSGTRCRFRRASRERIRFSGTG